MSLLAHAGKIPLLILMTWPQYVAHTPPNPVVTERSAALPASVGRATVQLRPVWMRHVHKAMMEAVILADILAIAAFFLPASIALSLPVDEATFATCARIRITPAFLVGWTLLVVGAWLKMASFRELGKHFTFEVTVQNDHRLVTTGPYSVVRHPAYTATWIMFVGTVLCAFSEGAWFRESGFLHTWKGRLIALLWVADLTYAPSMMVFKRVRVEDALMKKTFGKEWDEWTKQTPWAVLPWIY
ncbi:uncharacterized protein BXZ73DRAFT_95976 [Epithele typhae]|uniref:uncharacterized protein n=1 Tax=Epithele typhae TaxID=378194 RepID=UPI002008AB56|nr:uncharacterized protein BXZ73DRAFT_95976 [Epithele typhae]KAH9944989.1 hypothetical protein BXZ73DRAFT_95976 [Epithele typhae]